MSRCTPICKKLGAIVLLLVVLVQSFNKAIIIGDYHLNSASYAAKCENKTDVELNCNGRCLLVKKLKDVEEKEKKNPDRKAESSNDFYIFKQSVYTTAFQTFNENLKKRFPIQPGPSTTDRPHFIFRPPIG